MSDGQNNYAGIVLAGTQSGGGKTTLTLGILAALQELGIRPQPFKCGPDFIDPSLHGMVTGKVSRNLDLRMCGVHFVKECYVRHGASSDINVIEGVMGLFDGGPSSTAALAKALKLPVILIIDARSAAESVAALIKGFETFDADLHLAGIILNRLGSPRHQELIEGAVKAHCRAPVIGRMPRSEVFEIASRHLGLHMGIEAPLDETKLRGLAESVRTHVDLKRIMAIAHKAHSSLRQDNDAVTGKQVNSTVHIAVARDKAFCFCYQDNLDLLEKAGARLHFFSPLQDTSIPAQCESIILPGGYPELYAAELSANNEMREAIAAWSKQGNILYAECGGLMYLTEGIYTDNGFFPMAGVFPTRARMRNKLCRLGYREVTLVTPTCLGTKGAALYGHEFHYSDIDPMPAEITRAYQTADGREGYCFKQTLGSYYHLHFGRTPESAGHFVLSCSQSRNGQGSSN